MAFTTSVLGKCDIDHIYLNANKDDTMTGNLEMVDGDLSTDNQICINEHCRTTFASTTCAVGQVIRKINADGTAECSTLDCSSTPATPVYRGLDISGNPQCRAYPNKICPAGEYVTLVQRSGSVDCAPLPPRNEDCPSGKILTGLNDDGTIICTPFNCPLNKYYGGLDPSGNPICRDFPDIQCGEGEFLVELDEKGQGKCGTMVNTVSLAGNCGSNLIAGITRNAGTGILEVECRPPSYPDNNNCDHLGDRGAAVGINESGEVICACRPDEQPLLSSGPCW